MPQSKKKKVSSDKMIPSYYIHLPLPQLNWWVVISDVEDEKPSHLRCCITYHFILSFYFFTMSCSPNVMPEVSTSKSPSLFSTKLSA